MEATLSSPIDLAAVARGRLCNSPYMAIRSVSCDFKNGALLLRGRLPSFHHKQMAQEASVGTSHFADQTIHIKLGQPKG